MGVKKHYLIIIFVIHFLNSGFSQEGVPVYSDYLIDNYYLLHPSMAGADHYSKIRLTARQNWIGVQDAPSLQTISVNGRLNDYSPIGLGAILFNDSNGYHGTVGGYATFAYHLLFSRNEIDLNMLSFGLSAGFLQYRLDDSDFLAGRAIDPLINGINISASFFNIDFGFSYQFVDFYAHFTAKNVLDRDLLSFNDGQFRFDNLRTFMLLTGYRFRKFGNTWSYEPSLMFLYRDATQESTIDANFKIYKEMDFGEIYGGLSYRRSLDGAEFVDGGEVNTQKLQYFTPFVGVDYNNFIFSYTYSYQANTVNFNTGGFHQITLGYN